MLQLQVAYDVTLKRKAVLNHWLWELYGQSLFVWIDIDVVCIGGPQWRPMHERQLDELVTMRVAQ